MKILKRRNDIDLEVLHDPERDAWVVRHFGGDPKRVFAVEDTKLEAWHMAAALAKVIAAHWNRSGSCEIYVRKLDGTWDRDTHGRDPRRSKN